MKKAVVYLLLTLVTVLAGCASTRPVPVLDLAADTVPVAAEFVTVREQADHSHDHAGHGRDESKEVRWHMFRSTNRIDIDNVTVNTGETWLRDGKLLVMRQLFHEDRKGIEYLADDFAVLGMQPSWQRQAMLIDPAVLQALQETGSSWQDGNPLRHYRGDVDGQRFEVMWRVDVNLPYSLVRERDGQRETTRLLAVHPLAQSPWKYENGDGYELIDYADLGDRERDPFVLKIQSQLPGGDMHHH